MTMSSLIPADLSELADAVADRVADRLANRPRLVDRVELANQLGVSVPTVDRLRASGRIPEIKIGSRIQFDIEAVLNALREGSNDE